MYSGTTAQVTTLNLHRTQVASAGTSVSPCAGTSARPCAGTSARPCAGTSAKPCAGTSASAAQGTSTFAMPGGGAKKKPLAQGSAWAPYSIPLDMVKVVGHGRTPKERPLIQGFYCCHTNIGGISGVIVRFISPSE